MSIDDPVFVEGKSTGTSNGTTPVTVMPSPPASDVIRRLKFLSIYNKDTAVAVVTISLDENATDKIFIKTANPTLAVDATLILTEEDRVSLTKTTDKLEFVLGGTITTNELDWICIYEDEYP